MSKLNLIVIVDIVAAFAVSAVVVGSVFAQDNSTSASAGSNATSGGNTTSGSSMPGMNMTNSGSSNSSSPSQ